jgi:thiol-disulfide isomerase/thioredoxin
MYKKTLTALIIVAVIVGLAVVIGIPVAMVMKCPSRTVTQAARPVRMATELTTGEAADTALQSTDPTMVFVYADWCGFCKRADPIFTELAQDPAYAHVRLMKLNSANAPAFVQKHGIRGYPAFLVNWAQGDAAKIAGFKTKPEMVALINAAPRTRGGVRVATTQESVATEALKAPTPAVVFVSADWCGYCKKLIPIWDEVVASGKFNHINMLRIDAKDAPDLIKTHGITGFPVLLSNRGERKYIGYRPKDKLEEVLVSIGTEVSRGARVNTRRCPIHNHAHS